MVGFKKLILDPVPGSRSYFSQGQDPDPDSMNMDPLLSTVYKLLPVGRYRYLP
jgi:hypothetical protein